MRTLISYFLPHAFSPSIFAESVKQGWMHTGDLATMDAEGYVNIVGRIKDMIIRGGENVYPREIEEFLFKHPAVQEAQVRVFGARRFDSEYLCALTENEKHVQLRFFECFVCLEHSYTQYFTCHSNSIYIVLVSCLSARGGPQVFGIPDARLGEEVCAWVKLRAGHPALTEDALRAHCRANIAHFKVPKHVRFVAEFPMTVSGKAQKFLMRDAEIKARNLAEVKTA